MSTKMTILGIAVAMATAACAKAYVPAGARGLDVSGYYDTSTSVVPTKCAAISARSAKIRVDHSPGAPTLRLTYNQLSYDAKIDHDGNFRSHAGPYRDEKGDGTAYVVGKFSGDQMNAQVYATVSACEYRVRWAGTREKVS